MGVKLNNIFAQVRGNEEIIFNQEEELGSGGSSRVYPITYKKNGVISKEPQVMKVIDIVQLAQKSSNPQGLEAVMRAKLKLYKKELEVNKKIAACRCEHLISIFDTYVVNRPIQEEQVCLCAIRMPYYETLESLCQEGVLDEKMVIRLGTHICEALSVLHHDAKAAYYRASQSYMGVMVHMDIKPSNIFYQKQGENLIFILGDYGTLVDKMDGKVIGGTRDYLAPELSHLIDGKSEQKASEKVTLAESMDIFSLGMTLFACLAGVDQEALIKSYKDAKYEGTTVTKLSNCSDELWKVIEKATDQNPEKRYQTAKEMQAALQNVDTIRAEIAVREVEKANRQNKKLKREKAAAIIVPIAVAVGKYLLNGAQEKNKVKAELSYGKNGTYSGEVKDNRPNGQGVYVYRYGEVQRIFEGKFSWVKEKVVFLGREVVYEGMKCDGEYCGFATIVIPQVGTFQGNVNKLILEEGTYEDINKNQYTGTWKKTEKGGFCYHGFGTYKDAQGNEITGEWNEGVLIEKEC